MPGIRRSARRLSRRFADWLAAHGQADAIGTAAVLAAALDGMLDFFGPGYDAARAMGVLPELKRVAYRIDEIAYVDRNGRRRAHLDCALFDRIVRGRLLSLMRPDLDSTPWSLK